MNRHLGCAPRSLSLRSLAVRTAKMLAVGSLLTAVIISLIRADIGFEEQQGNFQLPNQNTGELKRAADLENRLLLDARRQGHRKNWQAYSQQELNRLHQDKAKQKTSIYDTDEFREQLKAQAEEPLGQVSRLASSLQSPLGISGPEAPLCHPFNSRTRTVAIIGNGPLSKTDRHAIETHDVVVRFNLMNNWQRFQERVDVWIMRYSKEAVAGYWGINNIVKEDAKSIIAQLKGIWLVGGNQTHADLLLDKHPEMEGHSLVLMPEAPMNKAFAADILHAPFSYPSTGFVGIQAVLHCTSPTVQLHIFGFNWSQKTWHGHNVTAERHFVGSLEEQGRAVVHPTACSGMRECGKGDIDASCHWSSAGEYMCLRGRPRKWVDMTAWVLDSRMQQFRANASAADTFRTRSLSSLIA